MRILVVDDDADIAGKLSRVLAHLGHRVVTCTDARKAILVHALMSFDIIITDYMMRPDGLEVLRAFPRAHRMMLTACYHSAEILEAIRTGLIQQILTKPATLADIKRALSAVP